MDPPAASSASKGAGVGNDDDDDFDLDFDTSVGVHGHDDPDFDSWLQDMNDQTDSSRDGGPQASELQSNLSMQESSKAQERLNSDNERQQPSDGATKSTYNRGQIEHSSSIVASENGSARASTGPAATTTQPNDKNKFDDGSIGGSLNKKSDVEQGNAGTDDRSESASPIKRVRLSSISASSVIDGVEDGDSNQRWGDDDLFGGGVPDSDDIEIAHETATAPKTHELDNSIDTTESTMEKKAPAASEGENSEKRIRLCPANGQLIDLLPDSLQV